MKNNRKIVAIVGPTASGKTGLGVAIAKKYNGEIVSADSRQVFRGLDIGTGKDLQEYGDIKYHLIDICDPGEKFTMFDWLDKAKIAIEDIFSRGKLPVIVGGTGLYVQALVEGFETKNQELRIKNKENFTRQQLDEMPLEKLQSIFKKLQAKSYQPEAIDMSNPRRLIRVIEKVQGGEISSKKKPDFEVLQIALDYPREELYSRIDKRVDEWFIEGFKEEVEDFLKSGVEKKWFDSIGLEYRILADYIVSHPEGTEGSRDSSPWTRGVPFGAQNDKKKVQNDKEFRQMKQIMKYKIHQFARRQLTWWRRFPEVVWAKDKKEAIGVIDNFLK